MASRRSPNVSPGLAACITGCLAGVLAGCGGDRFEQRVVRCATPNLARESADPELLRLLAEVTQAKALARDLDGPLGPPDDNAAAALAACYSDELCVQMRPYVERLVIDATPSPERTEFLERNTLLVNKTAAAADLPRCRFAVDHAFGFFGRMRFLDDAALAAHLLTLRAMDAARRAEPGSVAAVRLAVADLERALVTAHRLAMVRRVEARVLAASLRTATLDNAERMLGTGVLGRAAAEAVYGTLREQLADWPDNARMLVGERAMVVHAYEAIRGGMLDRVLTLDERKRLAEAGLLDRLRDAPAAALDADQADYLAAMRALIESADLPAEERQAGVAAAIASARSGPLLFAAPLFLVDVSDALDSAVEDRARCEAWTIALAGAADLRPPPFRVSPLSGEPYEAAREAGTIAVTIGRSQGERVTLPVLAR